MHQVRSLHFKLQLRRDYKRLRKEEDTMNMVNIKINDVAYSVPAGILEGMMDNVAELQELGQQTKENIKQGLKKAGETIGETIEQGVESIKNLPIGKQ